MSIPGDWKVLIRWFDAQLTLINARTSPKFAARKTTKNGQCKSSADKIHTRDDRNRRKRQANATKFPAKASVILLLDFRI